MADYLKEILAVTVVVTACSLIAHRSGRATRFAFAVLIIYTVLTPISSLFSELDNGGLEELSPDLGELDREYEEVAERAFCLGIKELITSELGLSGDGVRVLCEGFDYKNMRAERIRVLLSGACITADTLMIRQTVEKNRLGRCEVEIEIG